MTKPRKIFVIPLLLAFALLLLFLFGESIWRPLQIRLMGGKTTAQVLRNLEPKLASKYPNLNSLVSGQPLFILAFKEERQLEVWQQNDTGLKKIAAFPFTAFSGKLGPKLQRGDRQIPEGIYSIEYLNPNSAYHLSMKVSYPNAFDRKMAAAENRTDLGDDIFIHGNQVTIGCIPLGDAAIEELFYLVAKNGFKNCEVVISPRDFRLGKPEPEIANISWTNELYEELKSYLEKFK